MPLSIRSSESEGDLARTVDSFLDDLFLPAIASLSSPQELFQKYPLSLPHDLLALGILYFSLFMLAFVCLIIVAPKSLKMPHDWAHTVAFYPINIAILYFAATVCFQLGGSLEDR